MIEPVSLLVGSILAELGKGALEDYVTDFFKERIKDVEGIAQKPFAKDSVKEAIQGFCALFLNELREKGVDDGTLSHYEKPLLDYIRLKAVKQELSRAFLPQCSSLQIPPLIEGWYTLQTEERQSWVRRIAPQKLQNAAPILFRDLRPRKPVPELPDNFNWQHVGQKYLEKVEDIVRDNEELGKLFDSYHLETAAKNLKQIAGIAPNCDLAKYAETIKERYANLKLESLDTTGCAYNELKLWQMFISQNVRECREYLPQVYELPKDFQRQLVERGDLEIEWTIKQVNKYQTSYQEQSILSISELLKERRNSYIAFLGDPGSGKSSLLQYIALEWAEKPLVELPLYPIPILIELRAYVRDCEAGHCKNFLDFIHQGSGWVNHLNRHQVVEYLNAGQAIALFDGLDEVFDRAQREDVISQIHNFTQQYDKVRIVVTSRVIGYKAQRLRDAGFSHFMLQDLDEKQIEDFIQRWHERTYQNEGERNHKRERLRKAVEGSKAIRELAGNPLLLTMMAILNRNQELPRDREELYNQASRLLLHQWDVERQLEDEKLDPMAIDYRDKQAMLRRVAHKMQASEKGLAGNIIEARELEGILTEYLKEIEVGDARTVARLLIQQLRERNFILCSLGADYYAFVHRTFLEYFCARAFVWEFKETRALGLENLKREVFERHWREEAWHEVLRLICGMLDARFVGEILGVLMEQEGEAEKFGNVFLAASCLLEVRERGRIASVDEALRATTRELEGGEELRYARVLEILRDRADNDPDEKLREWARGKLAEWG